MEEKEKRECKELEVKEVKRELEEEERRLEEGRKEAERLEGRLESLRGDCETASRVIKDKKAKVQKVYDWQNKHSA